MTMSVLRVSSLESVNAEQHLFKSEGGVFRLSQMIQRLAGSELKSVRDTDHAGLQTRIQFTVRPKLSTHTVYIHAAGFWGAGLKSLCLFSVKV